MTVVSKTKRAQRPKAEMIKLELELELGFKLRSTMG